MPGARFVLTRTGIVMIEKSNASEGPPLETCSQKPSRDELFRLLTEEIRDFTEAEKSSGWTPWLILASLTSASWILIQDFWSGNFSSRVVTSVFLLVASSLALIRSIQRGLEDVSSAPQTRVSFFSLPLKMPAQQVLASCLIEGSLSYALFRLDSVSTVFKIAAAFCGLFFLIGLLAVLIIILRLPVPIPKTPKRNIASLVWFLIFNMVYLATIIEIIRTGVAKGATLIDVRIGGLLTLSLFAVLFLTRSTSRLRDARYELVEIRRNLVLCNISETEAADSVRIALQGMWLSDVMSKDVRSLLRLIGIARSEYTGGLSKIEAVKANVRSKNLDSCKASELDKLAVRSTMEALDGHLQRLKETIDQYQRLQKSVQMRLRIVVGIDRDVNADKRRLTAEIEAAEEPVNELQKRFVAGYREIQLIWNQLFPDELRNKVPFHESKDVNP